MNKHIYENFFGEKPTMSKRKALQRRFCELALNAPKYINHMGVANHG